MVSAIASRVRRMLPTKAVVIEREKSYRDLVILTAREVLETGHRQVVPLKSKSYTYLAEAKAQVVEHNFRYSLKDYLIFQEAASLILRRLTEFRNLEVFANSVSQPRRGESLVQIYIRRKKS